MSDLLTVQYMGDTLLSVDQDGTYRTGKAGDRLTRVAGQLEVDSAPLRAELKRLREVERAAFCNPYRDAVMADGETVYKAIPREHRDGIRKRGVRAVLDAAMAVAKRGVQ